VCYQRVVNVQVKEQLKKTALLLYSHARPTHPVPWFLLLHVMGGKPSVPQITAQDKAILEFVITCKYQAPV
jgi:hypothetical protein